MKKFLSFAFVLTLFFSSAFVTFGEFLSKEHVEYVAYIGDDWPPID